MFYELPVSNVGLPQRYVKRRSFFEDSKPKFTNVFAVRYCFITYLKRLIHSENLSNR